MVRTGAGDQNPSGPEHLQRPEVQLLVATQGSFQVPLVLGEGWRIEDDGVVLLSGGGVVAQQVEGVGFRPLDFAAVQGGILIRDLQSGPRAIYSANLGAPLRHVKGKTSLITKNVQSLPARILSGGRIVFPLVEEGPCLLPFERLVVKRRRSS